MLQNGYKISSQIWGKDFFSIFSGFAPDKRETKFSATGMMGILHKADRFLPLFMKK